MSPYEPKLGPMEQYEHAPLTGQEQHPAPAKLTFVQKFIRHYKQYWWAHLTAFILIGLLLTLLLIFVGFPRISQDQINDSKFYNLATWGTDPTPDSIHVVFQNLAQNDSPFHPTLDAFNASLYLPEAGPDNPFIRVESPAIHAKKFTNITVSQTAQILDKQQFINYNIRTLQSDTYIIGFSGTTSLHLGSLPTQHVNFTKLVNVTGLNTFKGFQITNFTLSLMPDANGNSLFGEVLLPNQSNFTLAVGNITQNVAVDGEQIGTARIENVYLRPGDNYFNMTSATNQTRVLELIKAKYKDGVLPIQITGNTTTYSGKRLDYFEAGFAASTLTAKLDLAKALGDIGINVTSLVNGGNPIAGAGGAGGSSSASSSGGGLGGLGSTSSSSGGGLGFGATSSSAAPLFGASTTSAALFGATTST